MYISRMPVIASCRIITVSSVNTTTAICPSHTVSRGAAEFSCVARKSRRRRVESSQVGTDSMWSNSTVVVTQAKSSAASVTRV